MLDDEIDRTAYDAELYDGQNDGTCIHLTNNQQKPSSLTSLFVFELQQLMDDITSRDTILRAFTKVDLNAHISSHWTFHIQVDSGASDCITLDKHILKHYNPVKPRSITTAEKGYKSCAIVGEGYLDIQTAAGDWLTGKALHIPNAVGTKVSPTCMSLENPNFTSWDQITYTGATISHLLLYYCHEHRKDLKFHLHHHNNCWLFIHQGYLGTIQTAKGKKSIQFSSDDFSSQKTINSLNMSSEYELWHQRLLHPGSTHMGYINKCVDGIPHLARHDFHKCAICQ